MNNENQSSNFEPPMNNSHFTSEDRKTIYGLEFQQKQTSGDVIEIKADVKEIKDGNTVRLEKMENAYIRLSSTMSDLGQRSSEHGKAIDSLKDKTSDLPLIRKLVYGAVTLILIAVFSALIYLVVKN